MVDLYADGMNELMVCPLEINSRLGYSYSAEIYSYSVEIERPRWIWEAMNVLWPRYAEEICVLIQLQSFAEPYAVAAYMHGAVLDGEDLRPALTLLLQDAGAMAW